MAATAMGGSTAGAATGTCQSVIMDVMGALGSSQDVLANTTGATGALSTGIGFGLGNAQPTINTSATTDPGNGIFGSGQITPSFTDDATISLWRIGITPTFLISAFGNGGSRDDAAGASFGFKMVTAVGTVANGAVVETGFVNRTNKTITVGQSVFGSATAAQAAA